MLKLRDGKLHIFLRPGCDNYFYRFFFNGKYITRTTKSNNLALAKSIGETAYDSHRFQNFDPSGTQKLTWMDAEIGVLKSLATESKRTSRLKDYKTKFRMLRAFFQDIPLPNIKERTLDDFLEWRRTIYKPVHANYHGVWGKSSSRPNDKTIARDFDVIRKVLKYALREGVITQLPQFPTLDIRPTAKGWFELSEWKQIQKAAKLWIKDSPSESIKPKRQYTYDYLLFLIHTGMRVDECLCVTYEDVRPDKDDPLTCFITIRGGKLSYRMKPTQCIGLPGAVSSLERRRLAAPNHKPTDLVFTWNPAELVEELFEKAGVLYDERGVKRTAKSCRHSFIMWRLRNGVSVFTLAKNCRTSVKMIESHYGSYLNAELAKDELKMMRPRKTHKLEGEDE